MISVEDWAEIRRLHRAEQMPIRAIARQLGISKNTVKRALATNRPPVYSRPAKGSAVEAVEPQIRELLKQTPTMPATVIAERIGWDRGMTVLKERVRELRPAYLPVDPVSRTTYQPGELAQCDLWFPPADIPLGYGQSGRPPVLVMLSGHSRIIAARMLPTRTTGDLIDGHWKLLTGWNAVPRMLVWDNEAGIGRGKVTGDFAAFAGLLDHSDRLLLRTRPWHPSEGHQGAVGVLGSSGSGPLEPAGPRALPADPPRRRDPVRQGPCGGVPHSEKRQAVTRVVEGAALPKVAQGSLVPPVSPTRQGSWTYWDADVPCWPTPRSPAEQPSAPRSPSPARLIHPKTRAAPWTSRRNRISRCSRRPGDPSTPEGSAAQVPQALLPIHPRCQRRRAGSLSGGSRRYTSSCPADEPSGSSTERIRSSVAQMFSEGHGHRWLRRRSAAPPRRLQPAPVRGAFGGTEEWWRGEVAPSRVLRCQGAWTGPCHPRLSSFP